VNTNLVFFSRSSFFWRMFVWQRKLQSFLVFNLGNAAKFLDKQGVWKNLQSLIQIFFLELSVKDLLSGSFISQNFRDAENCFDIEPYHVTLIKEAGPKPTIQQFQCIISGYFGPLGSHKRESLTFFGNRKSFISILNKFRGHIKGAQKRRRPGPHKWPPRVGPFRTLQR